MKKIIGSLQSILAERESKAEERKENNLVNDSINGDFLHSIEQERKSLKPIIRRRIYFIYQKSEKISHARRKKKAFRLRNKNSLREFNYFCCSSHRAIRFNRICQIRSFIDGSKAKPLTLLTTVDCACVCLLLCSSSLARFHLVSILESIISSLQHLQCIMHVYDSCRIAFIFDFYSF